MNSQVAGILAELRAELTRAGLQDPATDAELLLGHVLDASRGRIQALAVLGAEAAEADVTAVRALAGERARRVPLQHLTGVAPFRGIELSVGPGVFVPRPETETVAQFAVDALRAAGPEPLAVDLCTGSGAIALALAHEIPAARVWAVERSRDAHAWAERNVAALGDGRVELLLGDVAELEVLLSGSRSGRPALADSFAPLAGRTDVLVSNPPYVPDAMVPRDPEVREHDPPLALYGGVDGLDLVRSISRIGLELVTHRGTLVLEHAETQGAAIRELLATDGWLGATTHQDLTGRDRATVATAPGQKRRPHGASTPERGKIGGYGRDV